MILSNGQAVPSQIDTIADTTPLFADASYYATSALPLGNSWAAYGALYKYQLWVGIVVRKLARGTARLPLDVKEQLGENDQRTLVGPLAAILAKPNERLHGFRLWEWTTSTFDVYGEAFWLKIRDDRGVVRELHPMHPTNVIVRRSQETGELEYVYSTGVRNVSMLPPIPAADVVPFLSYNPDNITRGWSNLEGLRQTLLNEDAARRATASWWQRGARPSVALRHPGQLSEKAQERLRKAWESEHSGADLMGGTAILEEGMEAQVIQLSAEEMQYIQSRKLNREEVCAAYDVPPPVVHILDNATYSNITEQMRSMYRDTMAPRLEMFEAVLDHHLVPDFYSGGAVFSRFNMDEVMRGEFETRATAARELVQSGVLKPSEARPMFNLAKSDDPAADLLYGNAALVPLGSSVHGAQEVDSEGNLIPTPLPGTTAGTDGTGQNQRPTVPIPEKRYDVRSVARRLGRVKAAGGDVRKALVAEHTSALEDFYRRQGDSLVATMKAAPNLNDWNGELAQLLAALGLTTAKALGEKVAKHLGGTFDDSSVADWVTEDAGKSAERMNANTAANFDAATTGADDPSAAAKAFRDALISRAAVVARSRVAVVGGLAEQSAARQSGAATKTWVTGPNPRAEHAAVNGETVPLGELFSNGMDGPGDPVGGVDEVAGCNCSLIFDLP